MTFALSVEYLQLLPPLVPSQRENPEVTFVLSPVLSATVPEASVSKISARLQQSPSR